MDLHCQQGTLGVGDDMTFASLDALGHVKPAWATTFRRFHTLAVDDPGRWSGLASLPFSHAPDQGVIDRAPQARPAPLVEIILNRRAGRKVFRQRTPLTAAGANVEDRIHDYTQIDLPRATAPAARRHQGFNQFPFCIRHVACITKSIAPILFSGDFGPTHVVAPSSLRKHERITTD